jgi:hypothetical protein
MSNSHPNFANTFSSTVSVTVIDLGAGQYVYSFNGEPYDANKIIPLGVGEYTITVPYSAPIGFHVNDASLLEVTGGSGGNYRMMSGQLIEYFFGTFTLTVKGDFGVTSYSSWKNGGQYFGGQNRLVFSPNHSAENYFYEVFTTNDDINTYFDVKKYLNCPNTTSYDIRNVHTETLLNGFKTYKVFYYCDASKKNNDSKCSYHWSVPCDGVSSISSGYQDCKLANYSASAKWFYDSSNNQLLFNQTNNEPCIFGCSMPSAPSFSWSDYIHLCPGLFTPTFTPPNTPTLTATTTPFQFRDIFQTSDEDFHLAGDKQNCLGEVSWAGHCKVIEKASSSHVDDRVFYKETLNGYFYEMHLPLLLAVQGFNSLTIHGETIFFDQIREDDSELNNCYSDLLSLSLISSLSNVPNTSTETPLQPMEDFANYLSIVESYITPTPVPVDLSVLKDEGLISKIWSFDPSTTDFKGKRIASLNDYWIHDLPEYIYGTNQTALVSDAISAWTPTPTIPGDVELFHFPYGLKVTIEQDDSNLSEPLFSFASNVLVSNTYSKGWSLPGIEIFINRLPSDFDVGNSRHYVRMATEPIIGERVSVASRCLKLKLKYTFDPYYTKDGLNFSGSFPISKLEEYVIFLSPRGSNWNAVYGSYGDYAVDKTFGVTEPKFNLVKGFGYALPHTKRTPI